MNCETFCQWLENRDTYDMSESDRARRHASDCERCRQLLEKDEVFDRAISKAMSGGRAPESLKHSVDLSLDRMAPARKRGGLFAALSAACLVAALVFSFSMTRDFSSMDELAKYMLEGHIDHGSRVEIFEPVEEASVWLAGKVDSSVHEPVHIPEGYRVRGARFCTLAHCRVVHMIYEKDGAFLSAFVIAEEEIGFRMEPGRTYSVEMTGNRVTFWRQGQQVFALVS